MAAADSTRPAPPPLPDPVNAFPDPHEGAFAPSVLSAVDSEKLTRCSLGLLGIVEILQADNSQREIVDTGMYNDDETPRLLTPAHRSALFNAAAQLADTLERLAEDHQVGNRAQRSSSELAKRLIREGRS